MAPWDPWNPWDPSLGPLRPGPTCSQLWRTAPPTVRTATGALLRLPLVLATRTPAEVHTATGAPSGFPTRPAARSGAPFTPPRR